MDRSTHRRARKLSLRILLILVLASLGIWAFGCKPRKAQNVASTIPDAVKSVVTSSERELRDELRPLRGEERLLVFAIDGLGRDELAEMVSAGHAPVLAKFLGESGADGIYERGYLATETLSVLPSSTIAAWSTIFTGAVPAATGIPGNEFFLREDMTFYSIAPTSVTSREHALETVNDGMLNELLKASTLYERANVRAHVSLSQVYRGADIYTMPDGAVVEFALSTAMRPVDVDDEVERTPYEAIDSKSYDAVADAIDEHGIPDLQVIYLPGLDLFSHASKHSLEKQNLYFSEVIDPFIGKVLELYQTAGALDRTWIVFVSDHGHTPVLPEKSNALEVEDFQEHFAKIGFTLRQPLLDVDEKNFSAVLAAQGGLGYLYLADRSRCDTKEYCDWQSRPRWKEDVLPVVEMLEKVLEPAQGAPAAMDMILTRDPKAKFQVWDDGALHPVKAWVAKHDLAHYVEFAERLSELTEGPYGHRAGEVILVPRFGVQLPIEERYYFGLPMKSDHGSATVQDSRFTLLVARANESGEKIRDIVDKVAGDSPRQDDFVPLSLELLDLSAPRR